MSQRLEWGSHAENAKVKNIKEQNQKPDGRKIVYYLEHFGDK